MTARVVTTASLVAITLIAASCNRADTAGAAVKTTSPAGTSAAPSSDSAKHRDEALLRIVHASPSASNVDLFAGDLLLFDGIGFKSVTPYRAVDGQRYAFALRPAGMPRATPLSSNTENLTDGAYYTAFAMPGDGHPNLRIVNDHLDSPASGKSRLRVVHAGGDAGKIDLRANGAADALFDDVDYETVSDYRDVAPVNGELRVVGNDAAAPVLATVKAHLEAGRFYTLVIVGNARATPSLEAFLIEDALTP